MIDVQELTRVYGRGFGARPAVDRVTFSVARGEILGFLGPNGAGKSTTMKMLTCYLPPTSGRARVAGYDVYDDPLEVRRRVGYLPENTPLYPNMTVIGYLRFCAQVRRIERHRIDRRIAEVGATTGILDVLGKYIRELSRGYRQRVGLTQALLHDPDVLILDEPTSGLDPNQIVEIRELIRTIGRDKTILLSTHILPEVQATCNRVLIIHDGRIVADGRPDELVSREADNRYRLVLAGDGTPAPDDATAAVRRLDGVTGVDARMATNGELELVIAGARDADLRLSLFRLAADSGWPLVELVRTEMSLEQVFSRLTGAGAEHAAAGGTEAQDAQGAAA
ncbi:MAG: ATP-binding cassette domain-containing protein [Deltaproteobacteria bacterium]|nr:MAG: ATP-binding cassette domain-containing protein [Deltaproteobacteria bacterium]